MPTRGSTSPADVLIADVDRLLSSSATTSTSNTTGVKLAETLARLELFARSRGFDSNQCSQLIHLALRGTVDAGGINDKRKPPRTSTCLAILKCVVPAPNVKLKSQNVLAILSSLGPSPGTHMEQQTGFSSATNHDSALGDHRTKVDIKVQAAVIKLLLVLFDSPPLPLNVAAALVQDEQQRSNVAQLQGTLPTSYLTLKARTTLDRCYGVLFHFLDYQTLRPSLCHLLCKLTRRKHVKHYRITKLMAIRANATPEPALSALLSTYANFYPDLLFPELIGGGAASSSSIGSGATARLKYPDTEWLNRVVQCHSRHARRAQGDAVDSDGEQVPSVTDSRPAKRAKVSLGGQKAAVALTEAQAAQLSLASIPNLVTVQPLSSINKALGSTPSLITELSSLRHLAHSLDRLVLPSQVAAMLAANFGARLMRVAVLAGASIVNESSLSQEDAHHQTEAQDECWIRLSDWLESVLRDEIGVGSTGAKQPATGSSDLNVSRDIGIRPPPNQVAFDRLLALLGRARLLFELSGEIPDRFQGIVFQLFSALRSVASPPPPPATSITLVSPLPGWSQDWDTICSTFLMFIPLTKPQDWSSTKQNLLDPLETIIKSSRAGLVVKAQVVSSLSAMLRNWGSHDWDQIARHLDQRQVYVWGISELDREIDHVETISQVAESTNRIVIYLLGRYSQSVNVEHAALSFYETLFSSSLAGLHSISGPPSIPFYTLCLNASSIMSLSRLSGLIQDLRMSFGKYDGRGQSTPLTSRSTSLLTLAQRLQIARANFYSEENRNKLNATVAQLANIIWKGKAFSETTFPGSDQGGFEQQAIQELQVRGDELGIKLTVVAATSHSQTFANLSERFANEFGLDNDEAISAKRRSGLWMRGPILPKTLKAATASQNSGVPASWTHQDFRAHLLDWIDTKGHATGLYELLKNSLFTLGSQLRSIRAEEDLTAAAMPDE